MSDINHAFVDAVHDELARIRRQDARTMSEDETAALFPEAWTSIQAQVADVQRCSDGATFLFLSAQTHGNQLRVCFAHDMTVPSGFANATEFRADIARVN